MNDSPWEDHLLERKGESDLGDLLKTLVAFANSVMPDHVATILIGELDNGTVQGVQNADNIQKKVRKEADKIYPAIVWRSRVYEKEGKSCVRVDIEASNNTPHFGGISWIRKGSSTVQAPDEMFQKLIELRLSKVRELSKWLGAEVSVSFDHNTLSVPYNIWSSMPTLYGIRWGQTPEPAKLQNVNNFWIELYRLSQQTMITEPLDKISLSFNSERQCLQIIVSA